MNPDSAQQSGLDNVQKAMGWSLFLVAIALAVWAVWESTAFQECVCVQTYQIRHQKIDNSSADVLVAALANPRIGFRCLGNFLDENESAITAIATILIAIFTLTLWLSTSRLAQLTKATIDLAQQEFLSTHRPKLILRDAFCDDNEIGNPIKVTYVIVNIGDTPARIVESALEIKVISAPGFGAQSRVPVKAGENPIGDSVINPGVGLEGIYVSQCLWRTDDGSRHNYSEPGLGVFFCGHFIYEDDRNIRRHTMFWRKYDFDESRFYLRKTRVIAALDNAD